jgi:hypothetical protein
MCQDKYLVRQGSRFEGQPLYWRIRRLDQVEFFTDLRDCGGQAPVIDHTAPARVSAEADVLRHRDAELMRLLWRQGSFTGT